VSRKILFCTSVFQEDINSAGRHMIDLVREFDRQGFSCEVVTNVGQSRGDLPNTTVRSLGLSLRGAAKPLRLLYEMYTPLGLYLKQLSRGRPHYAAAVAFSPSIFWYWYLKFMGRRVRGKKILILRDIFPLWLADVGMLSSTGITYRVLNYFCRKQLESYDVILVQNESDVEVLRSNYQIECCIDVLANWYSPSPKVTISDEIIEFCDSEAFTLAVVGNFGPAQDLEHSCAILGSLLDEFPDVRILFVGQGEEARNFFALRLNQGQDRVRFEHQMSHDEVINTLAYVDAGYFSLDEKNQQGHFPGKVLAYLMAGLPVFGSTGVKAPISNMLKEDGFGVVTHSRDIDDILKDFRTFKSQVWPHHKIQESAHSLYGPGIAFDKILGYSAHHPDGN